MKRGGFIYLWTNKIDGMKYVGRHTGTPDDAYVGSGKYFRRAYMKYGRQSFVKEILEWVEDVGEKHEVIKDREQYYLNHFNAAENDGFYNISPNSHGGHHGHDTSGENNGMYGKTHPNHKPLFGANNGMYGVIRLGYLNPMFGKTHDVDSRRRISEGAKKQVKEKCCHCGKLATKGNIARWHNDNCKKKVNNVI